MANKRLQLDEKMKLISECRQSSLSDYRWCKEHDINPSTFYSWISKLRDRACATCMLNACIEIAVEDVSIRVNNEVDPILLAQLIKVLKGPHVR